MPVFRLTDQIQFPPTDLAEENGLLAIGGDLKPERLIMAYSRGIFPWYSQGDPLLWWFTAPRLVIFPDEFRIPRRLARYAKKSAVSITRDQAFSQVIRECATVRIESGEGTWISPEMETAFITLHHLGYAHSIECWLGKKLVGGLYGLALDKVFFGESMFSREKLASQFGLVGLVNFLKRKNYKLIDCQMTTNHLLRFGAREISGNEFQNWLRSNIRDLTPDKEWKNENHP
jgi:leucyl/phenylalanyl-tRNA--protein transferase